jgi:hypothetical protein
LPVCKTIHLELAESVATGSNQYTYPFFKVEADRIEAEDERTDEWLRVRAIVSGLFSPPP